MPWPAIEHKSAGAEEPGNLELRVIDSKVDEIHGQIFRMLSKDMEDKSEKGSNI